MRKDGRGGSRRPSLIEWTVGPVSPSVGSHPWGRHQHMPRSRYKGRAEQWHVRCSSEWHRWDMHPCTPHNLCTWTHLPMPLDQWLMRIRMRQLCPRPARPEDRTSMRPHPPPGNWEAWPVRHRHPSRGPFQHRASPFHAHHLGPSRHPAPDPGPAHDPFLLHAPYRRLLHPKKGHLKNRPH